MITMTQDGSGHTASIKLGETTFEGHGAIPELAYQYLVERVEKAAAGGDKEAQAVKAQVESLPAMAAAWLQRVEALRVLGLLP